MSAVRTPEMVERALALREAGETYSAIAQELGTSQGTVRRICDPAADAAENERRKLRQAVSRTRAPVMVSAKDVRAIPRPCFKPDTRDLTARLFGDPMPGRSALDQRRGITG